MYVTPFTMDRDLYGVEKVSEDDRESLRCQFKPRKVKFLFIGESPPQNRDTFFYKKTGALFHNTREAFTAAGSPWMAEDDECFLEHFKKQKCYLVDLCKAGEKVTSKSRSVLDLDVGALAKAIEELKPEKVIIVIRRIKPFVVKALKEAGHQKSEPDCVLDFPAHGHQGKYRDQLSAFLLRMAEFPGNGVGE